MRLASVRRLGPPGRVSARREQDPDLGEPRLRATAVTKVALIILVILFGGGFYYGGSYIGDSLGTGLLIDLIVFLLRQRSHD